MIPSWLSKGFAANVRTRGDGYFASGKVRMARATAVRLQAVVRGTTQYAVDINARDGSIDLSCTCPYANDVAACKHLWAVLRQSDTDGTLAPLIATSGKGVRTEITMEDLDSFDDDEFDEFDEFDDDGERGSNQYPLVSGESLPNTQWPRVPAPGFPPRAKTGRQPAPPPIPDWVRLLERAHRQMQYQPLPAAAARPAVWPANRRLVYILDLEASAISPGLVIDLGTELLGRDGTWGEAKRFSLGVPVWFAAPDQVDQQIAEMLCGSSETHVYGRQRTAGFVIGMRAFSTTLRTIIDTGRCRLRSSTTPGLSGRTLHFDGGAPWTFHLRVRRDDAGSQLLTGILVRADQEMLLNEPLTLHAEGFLIANDTVARFDHAGAFPLVFELRHQGPALSVPDDLSELLARMYALPHLPHLDLPAGMSVVESHAVPLPAVSLTARATGWRSMQACHLDYEFVYGTLRVRPEAIAASLFDKSASVLHHRQLAFERDCLKRLQSLGAKEEYDYRLSRKSLVVARTKLSELALSLVREGWHVSLEGISYKVPGAISANVTSGIDWFDLSGSVRYGDTDVPIAAILDARRRGDEFVSIGDGSQGLLPVEWLEQLGPLIAAGDSVDGRTRYRRSQLSLLDALLATLPDADVDATFERARAELSSFATVAAVDPPTTFTGTLREYQREGLGWLHFLRRFGLGGCLADDMGLGKTVQVLALLDARRVDGHGPSIVVVPRSLVFNWLREASRFTPGMRMLDFSVSDRQIESIQAATVDVVVTTYGGLRRDAPLLAGIEFDYAILDEAQAIKNATTATAKASRLLRAQHRLVMSGTPIENRIEELWSLLEFVNPGMLGASTKFSTLARLSSVEATDSAQRSDADGRSLLARALRPVILRRTKEHVAPELPARIEQTLEVELEPKQRKFYEAIRKQVQQNVMDRVARQGIAKSQLHILEALLRLRQAACHPALVDPSKKALPSAKLDALIPALTSIAAEGHKSLVFSQFTSLLALVRERLDADGIRYEYLDGRTRDRQARVDRFQADAECPVFLISLKAGGHGLNLTAADYVYLLDPWWNPAVEAQAIDRAHRIGQTRRVIATRLVARDTIEAKILQLQASKRALADAVLTEDKGGLASIGRGDLELLLG